jgi:hypothetical protein
METTITKEIKMETANITTTHKVTTKKEAQELIFQNRLMVTDLGNTEFQGFHTMVTIQDGAVFANGIAEVKGDKVFSAQRRLTLETGMMDAPVTSQVDSAWVKAMTA